MAELCWVLISFSFLQMQPAAEQIAQMRRCVAVSPHYWVLLFETRVVSHCAQISPVMHTFSFS